MIQKLSGQPITVSDENPADIKKLKQVTHVVAAADDTSVVHPKRFKFVFAVVKGCPIINLKWVQASFKAGEFIPTNEYIITDLQAKFPLLQSVRAYYQAKKNGGLLKGITIVLCGRVAKKDQMPHTEGFRLLADESGATLLLPTSAAIGKIHPSNFIIVANSTQNMAPRPAEAARNGALVLSGAKLFDAIREGRIPSMVGPEAERVWHLGRGTRVIGGPDSVGEPQASKMAKFQENLSPLKDTKYLSIVHKIEKGDWSLFCAKKQKGNAATFIQKIARGNITRKKVLDMKVAIKMKAAIKLQAVFRGVIARKNNCLKVSKTALAVGSYIRSAVMASIKTGSASSVPGRLRDDRVV